MKRFPSAWRFLPALSILACAHLACSGEDEGGNESGDGDGDGSGDGDGAASGGAGAMGSGGESASSGGASTGGQSFTSDAFSLSESGGLYTLEHEGVTMVVDPSAGARITSFSVGGVETLVQEGDAYQYGSTFWPSPQTWNWPPTASLPEIDALAYEVIAEDQRLILTSANNTIVGLTVTKVFTPAKSASGSLGVSVEYTIENTNDDVLSVAAWEISRAPDGVVFYPEGPGGVLEQSTLSVESALGHAWYTYDANGLDGVPKVFADGSEGWLAWASEAGTLVIKSFPDIGTSEFAPNEAEVELYADPSGDYMEVEQQGPVRDLEPGETLTWTVEWYGAPVVGSVAVENGSQGLVDLVGATL